MLYFIKRYLVLFKYKSVFDKNNNIIGMDIDIILDGGVYLILFSVVF